VSLPDETLLGQPITLTNCDREPIHIPGAIQPYGVLLCLDEQTQRVVHASANAASLLGLPVAELLDAGLDRLLAPDRAAEVASELASLTEGRRLLGVRLDQAPGRPYVKLILHRYDGLLWLELEPVAENSGAALDLGQLNASLSRMLGADTVQEFSQHVAEQVRAITGFDRVAVYRFAPDESGEVIAEDRHPDLLPWLGLHYPASDIPQQARAMYLKNWLRFIPDAHYVPVPLVPVRTPATNRPPDMTYAVLRSVSPIHLEYLHNMGSAATMTISLIQDDQLWGMITCHHRTPLLVSYELRDLCEFVGKTFSALLPSKQQQQEYAYRLHISQQQARLFEHVRAAANFVGGLHQQMPTVRDIFACGGAAVCFDDDIVTIGATPTKVQIRHMLDWLRENVYQDVFATNSYPILNPEALAVRATASGLLAASLADAPGNYLLWFRPEVVQTVTWAGQHEKPQTLADGQIFLSPRQSFEAWRQLVENTSAPWLPLEIESARQIRLHIFDVRLKAFNELQARAEELSVLNTELERSNDELDSFAYVASHDLKEPLRGIHNYSLFLLEDYADKLDADGVNKLQTLVRLSQRMERLIEALLQLSRVGRQELTLTTVDMNALVSEVLELLQPRLEQTHTTVEVTGPLPSVLSDRTRLQEVLTNLLTNAMKYSDKPSQTVRLGVVGPGEAAPARPVNFAHFYVFYVKDQGIGIDPRHHENIFRLFKRLHAHDQYGGGTGAGLAIAKKMVEKHGGNLWVESTPGQGATFYFSLPKTD